MVARTNSPISRRKALEAAAGAWALDRLQRWLARRPPEQAERFGERVGLAWFWLSRKHRSRALANLDLAFPEWSPQERRRVAREAFLHFGRSLADFLLAPRRSPEDLERSMSVSGRELLDEAYGRGRGVILVTGHLGNWERMSVWLAQHGYPMNVVFREARSDRLNRLVEEARTRSGVKAIPRGSAARPILEALRRGELVGILPDQNEDEAFVRFFGHPAGTTLGPGVIAERTGAPVVPCVCFREGPQRFAMRFEEPLRPCEGHAVKGEGMMQAIHDWLERTIRERPEQWLWMHDRWRSARLKGLL